MDYFDVYKIRLKAQKGKKVPQYKRDQSEMVVRETWYNDPEVVSMKLYKHKEGTCGKEYELIGEEDARFIHKEMQEYGSQAVAYYVQFLPHVHYPIGSYIQIPDEDGKMQWWLIVDKSKDLQFAYYDILPCNYTVKWVKNNHIYQCLCVVRSVNSYSSGVKTKASLMELTDNRCKMVMPSDEVSKNLFYGVRIIVSSDREVPFVWKTTKIEEITPVGISTFTIQQDKYNELTDKASDGTMVADINTRIIHNAEEAGSDSSDTSQKPIAALSASILSYCLVEDKTNLVQQKDRNGEVAYVHPDIAQVIEDGTIKIKDRLKFIPQFRDQNDNIITVSQYADFGITPLWKVEGLEILKQQENGEIVYDENGKPVVDGYNYADYSTNEDYELTFKVKKNYYLGGTKVTVKLYSNQKDLSEDHYISKDEFIVEV